MKKIFVFTILLLFSASLLFSQVSVNTDGSAPHGSAMLDVNSTSKGVLIPRMTLADIGAITDPADGLMVFCTDCGSGGLGAISIFMAGAWYTLGTNYLIPRSASPGSNIASPTQIVWKWHPVINATGYKWYATNDYDNATDMGTDTSKTETGLDCNTSYTRYVWVYTNSGVSFPTILTESTSGTSVSAPVPGTHVPSSTQIVWNWNTIEGATGYRFGTTNVYEDAVDVGSNLSYTETGLTCNTSFTRYVWAIGECGNSDPVTLTQSTVNCSWACGDTITKNHTEGSIAPVTKTVTYGTVTNIAGETSKCWITSNLGADHQATAVSDATEPSAGWYWQFNQKQGFKHTGSARIPNTWIGTSGNTDWLPANDPCNLELGGSWRLPTSTEWANVDATGNWTNWDGPWNSPLKIHAAGYLERTNGSLGSRGSDGYYWSSTVNTSTTGNILYLYSGICQVGPMGASYGFTVRCLRENTEAAPENPPAGSHIPAVNQIIWTWNTVIGATGYRWNTVDDYNSALDLGNSTTNTETNLTCNTIYTRYVWAYNIAGQSGSTSLAHSTLSCSWGACGDALTINHVAGTVAPVNKTVTYGTVTNVPGEPSKCWITSNLGSDHQATAVNDATEASAGWYWQFNRPQGYKYEGTNRTPNTLWITNIYENSDWLTSTDPCALSLGTGWRVPTGTEWTNVDAIGYWSNWDYPWASLLKMHAAGYLSDWDGSLGSRGSNGFYWSSSQSLNSSQGGQNLYFYSTYCYMNNFTKAYGYSVRCLRE
jgi:hypothetical protein